MNFLRIVRSISLGIVTLLLLWRIIVNGMVNHLDLAVDNMEKTKSILTWAKNHPEALKSMAQYYTEMNNISSAEKAIKASIWNKPSDATTATDLANVWDSNGDKERAAMAMNMAGQLYPAHPVIHMALAEHWLEHKNVEQAIEHWNVALQSDSSLQSELFPRLLKIVEDEDGAKLEKSATQFPHWWRSFFVYAVGNAKDRQTLTNLYQLRKLSDKRLHRDERSALVTRFQQEGLWSDAYITWVNALRPELLDELGYIYDGGFERAGFKGEFDWSIAKDDSFFLRADRTSDIIGKKALHVIFRDRPVQHTIIQQPLLLTAGKYRLTGKVQFDRIIAEKGAAWIIRCATGDKQVYAVSERFLGVDKWRDFSTEFVVPNDCEAQQIALTVLGKYADQQKIDGEIWFDTIAIEPVKNTTQFVSKKMKTSVLAEIEGTILVNQGSLYTKAQPGITLNTGARVFALEDSQALVKKKDGSSITIEPNTIVIID